MLLLHFKFYKFSVLFSIFSFILMLFFWSRLCFSCKLIFSHWILSMLQRCYNSHQSFSVHSHSIYRLNMMMICQTNWIIDRIDCKWILVHANGFLMKNAQIRISNFICIHEKIHKIVNWFISMKHGKSQIYPNRISIQTIQVKSFCMVITAICFWRRLFKWKEVMYGLLCYDFHNIDFSKTSSEQQRALLFFCLSMKTLAFSFSHG